MEEADRDSDALRGLVTIEASRYYDSMIVLPLQKPDTPCSPYVSLHLTASPTSSSLTDAPQDMLQSIND